MENGYNIYWTPNALRELKETIDYLERKFSEKELNKLALEIEYIVNLILNNPYLFQKSEFINIYKVVILRLNTMYYRINGDTIEIISFFSNRKNLKKRKMK